MRQHAEEFVLAAIEFSQLLRPAAKVGFELAVLGDVGDDEHHPLHGSGIIDNRIGDNAITAIAGGNVGGRALPLLDDRPSGFFKVACGDIGAGLEDFKRAHLDEPENPLHTGSYLHALAYAGEPEHAARELALGMAYEDTVRVAELKIRPSRFQRVRDEVQVADGQILEIAEFFHPRVQEIADTLPAGLGRWLLNSGWPRRFLEKRTKKGVVLKTSTIRGFLMLYFVASLKSTRPRSLRFQAEQAFLNGWLKTILDVAKTNYKLAAEIAMTRTLVKGYSDTHARGLSNYQTIAGVLDREGRNLSPAVLGELRTAARNCRPPRDASGCPGAIPAASRRLPDVD